MKILHISPFAELGGCEFNALTIVEEIKAQHDVLLLNDGRGPFVEKWENKGATIEHCNVLQKPFFTWKPRLIEQLEGRTYDIIIYWSHMHMPVVLSALSHFSKRILVHIGNPVIFGFKQKLLRSIQNKLYSYKKEEVELRPVSNYVLQSSITTPSYKKLKSKVSFKPIVVGDIKKESENTSKHKIIGMMARMDAIKDFSTLIYAFALLLKQNVNCVLHLAGDGAERNGLEKLTQQLAIQDKVVFLGRVDDKKKFYQGIDVFVYSTSEKEGLAGVVGEALVSGIPTLCSDLPMLKEWDPENRVLHWFKTQNPKSLTEELTSCLANYKEEEANAEAHKNYFKNKFSPKQFAENYIGVHQN